MQPRRMGLDSLKVMVIDDSKTIRRTAETLLKKAGCDVVTATDGFEALAKIADEKPDIIFVDIMMPRLDGYQTCALIKNNQVFKETPVIMLSSKDGLFDRARGRIVGSDQYSDQTVYQRRIAGRDSRACTALAIRARWRRRCTRLPEGAVTNHGVRPNGTNSDCR